MTRATATILWLLLAALLATGGTAAVWFVGFDLLWAAATVIAGAAISVAIAFSVTEDNSSWGPAEYEPPPGVRRDVATIAGSLAACDRLARPTAVRWISALLSSERDDLLARSTVMRRMRLLLNAELHDRGLNPADRSEDEAVVALLGPEAIAVLHPEDGTPVNTAAIERCLDAVERLATESQRSS